MAHQLTVFVACPYNIFPLDDYKKTFQSVEKSYDVVFRFADERITNQNILGKVKDHIRDHNISLFDITGWNPNVALELGIAEGLGKRYFILLNLRENKGVPSDIQGIERIQYSSNSELELKLILLMKQEIPQQQPGRSNSAFDDVKTKIIETLRTSPGLNLAKLAGATKLDKPLVQSAVKVLLLDQQLKTKGQRRGTIYYTGDTDLQEGVKRKILEKLRTAPGLSLAKLAMAIREDNADVKSAVRVLAQAGQLRTEGQRRGTVYFAGGGAN